MACRCAQIQAGGALPDISRELEITIAGKLGPREVMSSGASCYSGFGLKSLPFGLLSAAAQSVRWAILNDYCNKWADLRSSQPNNGVI